MHTTHQKPHTCVRVGCICRRAWGWVGTGKGGHTGGCKKAGRQRKGWQREEGGCAETAGQRKRSLRWFYIISADRRKLVSWGWGWSKKKRNGGGTWGTVCRGWAQHYILYYGEGKKMRLRFHTCCYLKLFSKLRLPRAPPSLLCIFIFPPHPELIPLSFNSVIAEQASARVFRT